MHASEGRREVRRPHRPRHGLTIESGSGASAPCEHVLERSDALSRGEQRIGGDHRAVGIPAEGVGPDALVLHNTGSMGKFFYETIEAADPGVMEAMQATGANRFKVIMFGILPNVLPNIMSVTLLYWEFSSRAATILGLVGAGASASPSPTRSRTSTTTRR